MNRLVAPFSPQHIAALDRYQHSFFHPFTCGNNRGDSRHKAYAKKHGGDWGTLVPTSKGWICPVCGYTQNWAHEGMVTVVGPHTEVGLFDAEPMGENPVTHRREPTGCGIRPVQTFYCIYDHPLDFPNNFVIRQWHIYAGIGEPIPGEYRLTESLDQARTQVAAATIKKGLPTHFERHPDFDDPKIVETWV